MEHHDLEGNARNFHFFFFLAFSFFFFLDPDENRLAAWNLYKVFCNNHQISLQKNRPFLSIQSSFDKSIKIPIFYSIYLSLSFEFVILLFRLRFKNRVFKTDDAQFTKLENVKIYRNIIRHQEL